MLRITTPARTIKEDSGAPIEDEGTRSLRLLIRLLRCSQAVKNRFRVRLDEEFGTTLAKWDMVATLARGANGMSMSQLSKALMVTNGNVTNVVNRLMREGLVLKRPVAGDRRMSLIHLTTKGWRLFETVADANRDWIARMLHHVSAESVDQLNALLGILSESIELSER